MKTCATGLCGLAASLSLLLGSTALAQNTPGNNPGQDEKRLTPPIPNPPAARKPAYIMVGLAIVITGIVVGVNFIPSKRGHQD
ncbi:MAG TPA: hypothetical protein VD963_03525 [Phycisphaerales bacterium]|nr:hypothetical protein [Phycisphaerales bacterium]